MLCGLVDWWGIGGGHLWRGKNRGGTGTGRKMRDKYWREVRGDCCEWKRRDAETGRGCVEGKFGGGWVRGGKEWGTGGNGIINRGD